MNNDSSYYETINGQPNHPQAVVYNISNTNGNKYVIATPPEATKAECPTEHADSQKQARAPTLRPFDGQHNVTINQLTPLT